MLRGLWIILQILLALGLVALGAIKAVQVFAQLGADVLVQIFFAIVFLAVGINWLMRRTKDITHAITR